MMWLAGTERPDYRTISDFRKEHLDAVAKLFVQFLQLAKALGMVKLGHVAIDGYIPKLQEEVRHLLQRAAETDQAEDQAFGDHEAASLPNELKEKEARLARMEAALEEAQGAAGKHVQAQWGSIQGYNGQLAVDGDSGVIVGATPQLIPTLDAIQEATGEQLDKASADTGFFSGEHLAELEARKIDGYVADAITETKRETDPYSKDHFPYDSDQDFCRCPQGHARPFKGEYLLPDGRVQRRYWNPDACTACPVRD
jgi:transposase